MYWDSPSTWTVDCRGGRRNECAGASGTWDGSVTADTAGAGLEREQD